MSSTVSKRHPETRARKRRQGGRRRSPAIARIAAGIDGFAEGQDAASLGRLVAEATGAELMLVAVHTAPLLPSPPELNAASLRKESQRILREVRDSFAP